MLQAIFGLVGVIVGGAITAGFQIYARRAQQKRDQRHAARVVLDQLVWWLTGLRAAHDRGTLESLDPPGAVRSAWDAHCAALIGLSYDDWVQVSAAVQISDAEPESSSSQTAAVQDALAGIDTAAKVLGRFA